MKLAIPKERRPGESRVAATPDTVKKLTALGLEVVVERGAGAGSSIGDDRYRDAGATIASDEATALGSADIVFKVQRPLRDGSVNELAMMKKGAVLIGMLAPLVNRDDVEAYADAGLVAFAMELMPRITRAQSMDVLSSQANLAGYRAVIDAAEQYGRALPMMMTAAGTVPAAKVFIMGVGVAGLQAIATARRLGAVVSATDVRPATKEQVESLGAKFVMVEDEETKQAETAGGYAREMSDDYKRKQATLIAETIKKQDIVITTALIPGRKAPVLVTPEMVATMKPGAVIIDLAVEAGGNCPLSKPDEIVEVNGVKIAGFTNLPSRIAEDASALYAKNLLAFVTPLIDKETKALKIDTADEIVAGSLLVRDGQVVHPALKPAAPQGATPSQGAAAPSQGPGATVPSQGKGAAAPSQGN
jgi:NAD(P) transhydrogenase subunit alpha